jgi:UDP-glucose 4-epimerase
LKGRRILITGGLGFVGSNLAHACVAQGAAVTLYDCLDPKSGGNRANIAEIEADVRVILDDIRDPAALAAALAGQEIVFHCAAYTSHPDSMRDPYVDVDVNCKGTLNLLESLRRLDQGTKLVHVGTSTQSGPMCRNPIDEDHPEFPLDIYSANKSVSEKYVLAYGRAYGLRVSVVRLSNTYGPRSNIRNPDLGFLNYFVGLALQGGQIRVFGDGSQLRTILYIGDAVDALILAATSPRADGRVYLAAGDALYSVAEITHEIVGTLGGGLRHVEWPATRSAIEIGDAVISNARIKAELGAAFPTAFRDGLARTREYFLPRLAAYL